MIKPLEHSNPNDPKSPLVYNRDEFDFPKSILEKIDSYKKEGVVLNNYDIELIKRELYEEKTGLYEHSLDNNPFSIKTVELHPGEDIFRCSKKKQRMEEYIRYKIKDIFNLSWIEYINQTRADVDMMLSICKEHNKALNKIEEDRIKELEKEARNLEKNLNKVQ